MSFINAQLSSRALSPERTLWLSVIQLALVDAARNPNRREREEAREWLTEESADLYRVCAMAGLDMAYLLRHTHKLAAAHGWSVAVKYRPQRKAAAPEPWPAPGAVMDLAIDPPFSAVDEPTHLAFGR